jgi:hypothetical protein
MHKYLYSIILGILFFIFLNKYDRFNIGIPYSDNSIINLPLVSKNEFNYKYCLLSMDGYLEIEDQLDFHYIICIINLDLNYFERMLDPSEIINVYTLGYGNVDQQRIGKYTSPNSYSTHYELPITSVDNLNQLNKLLFISWDNLDPVTKNNAEILGWKKSMWDFKFIDLHIYTVYPWRRILAYYKNLLFLNACLNESVFYLKTDSDYELYYLDFKDPTTFPKFVVPGKLLEYIQINISGGAAGGGATSGGAAGGGATSGRANTFNLNWTDLDATQTEAARFFGLTEENWEENKWFINLKSKPSLIKYRKVRNWTDLTDVQFKFLQFLKHNMLERGNTSIHSMHFCQFDANSGRDMLITEEDFLDPSSAGFFGEQCTTEGCCLDGAVSFLYDDKLENIIKYMTTNNSCSAVPTVSSCNIM